MWRLFRPHTLTASFIPVLTGTALAWRTVEHLRWGLLIAMLTAATLIQAATNMFNEYFDYRNGVDDAASVGIAGAITREKVRPHVVLMTAVSTLGLATLLGVYICARTSWWLAGVGAVSMLVGFLYTGGPRPIAATPFGELFAGAFMGTGITLISCFIQRLTIDVRDVLVSIPAAVLIGAILTANNIRDLAPDRACGRRTLAILLGHKWAVRFLACSLLFANLWVVMLVLTSVISPWTLLTLGSLGFGFVAVREFQPGRSPAEMVLGMQRIAQTNTVFGVLLISGLLLD